MIRKLQVDNYKSLRNFELDLRPFNVIVGANAAGKSNIIDALSFLQDCVILPNWVSGAVQHRGGWRGINANATIHSDTVFGLEIDIPRTVYYGGEQHRVPTDELEVLTYDLTLSLVRGSYRVTNEQLRRTSAYGHVPEVQMSRTTTEALMSLAPGGPSTTFGITKDRLALQFPLHYPIHLTQQIANWQFLNINPATMREAAGLAPTSRLEWDASNLAAMLRALPAEARARVREAMRRDIPGFDSFHTQEAGGNVFFTIDEIGRKGLPATSVSDGAVRLLALYTLYYGQAPPVLLCMEEPENGLHPELIETVVEYLRLLSQRTQVIVTTHSQLLVDHCRPEEIVLVEKVEGVSRAMQVDERSQIQEFLKEWTLGHLWTRDLLPLTEAHSGDRSGSTG